MKFMDNLYIGELVDDIPYVLYRLKNKMSVIGLYCICLSPNSKFFAEILSSRELFSAKNINKDYSVIGIAAGKPEAKELFSQILEDYLLSGELNISQFKSSFASEDFISI